MAIQVTKSTFTETQATGISFSGLSDFYQPGVAHKNVKFSKFKRDKTSVEPVVPDATENAAVAATDEDNLTTSSFENTIKDFTVTHPSTDVILNVNYSTYFNNNLTKNVPKTLDIDGEAVSSDLDEFGAELKTPVTNGQNEDIQNLDMNVNGAIYGAAGNRGQHGGGALYIESGDGNRNFNVNINSTGKVWGGGGGGNPGTDGSDASSTCSYTHYFTYRRNATIPGNPWYNPARHTSNPAYAGNGRGCRSLRGTPGSRGWRGSRGRSTVCTLPGGDRRTTPAQSGINPTTYRNTTMHGSHTQYSPISASGGTKGEGGVGEGIIQSWTTSTPGTKFQPQTNGTLGTSGGRSSCSSPYSGPAANANDGTPGNPGGKWGDGTVNTSGGFALKYKGNLTSTPGFGSANLAKGQIKKED